ncbi:hypothetical protein [Pectobacterium carotovorum]|nr:hypothetical protein [Pectobacterium carotovorum]
MGSNPLLAGAMGDCVSVLKHAIFALTVTVRRYANDFVFHTLP